MAELIIHKSGLFTSVQDLGRPGYRRYGVPISGAMDQQSAALANLLTNNPLGAPLLEITLVGPELEFTAPTVIAISGADMAPTLDGYPVSMNAALPVLAGQRLRFGKPAYGVRTYLAVMGGWQTEMVLGSCSQYAPVTEKSALANGEKLHYQPHDEAPKSHAHVKIDRSLFIHSSLKCTPGPEYALLKQDMKAALRQSSFTIGTNSRMGYQLESPDMPSNELQIITSQVAPGTIQLTPSGRLMALMQDAQVTGGYPRVLQLTRESINRLAQKATGEVVRFNISDI